MRAGAYTLAGTVSAVLVGTSLGALGKLLIPDDLGGAALAVAAAFGAVLAARQLGIVSFTLPQVPRQTQPMWARLMPPTASAALWGLDLGLAFSTWITFSGAWLLAAASAVSRDPSVGAALITGYWAGRAVSAWVGPYLHSATSPDALATCIAGQRGHFAHVHLLGIVVGVWLVLVAVSQTA